MMLSVGRAVNQHHSIKERKCLHLEERYRTETVQELPIDEQKDFRERLYEIIESASFIGWGYSDGLSGLYHKAFPDEI